MADLNNNSGSKRTKPRQRRHRRNLSPILVPRNPRDPLGLEITEPISSPSRILKKIYPKRRSKSKKSGDRPKKASKFPRGNSYYFYHNRNSLGAYDNRFTVMKREWFHGKLVLDVGCNTGHFMLAVASELQPRRITGIDVDRSLISTAWRNVRKFRTGGIPEGDKPDMVTTFFPFNVEFRYEDYADQTAQVVGAQYDCILALSVIKWIHLCSGDDALKWTFHRFFTELKPGGFLFLEYQTLHYYRKRKTTSAETLDNFTKMTFRPIAFEDYLRSIVGFVSIRSLQPPRHAIRGFRRRLIILQKPLADD